MVPNGLKFSKNDPWSILLSSKKIPGIRQNLLIDKNETLNFYIQKFSTKLKTKKLKSQLWSSSDAPKYNKEMAKPIF